MTALTQTTLPHVIVILTVTILYFSEFVTHFFVGYKEMRFI